MQCCREDWGLLPYNIRSVTDPLRPHLGLSPLRACRVTQRYLATRSPLDGDRCHPRLLSMTVSVSLGRPHPLPLFCAPKDSSVRPLARPLSRSSSSFLPLPPPALAHELTFQCPSHHPPPGDAAPTRHPPPPIPCVPRPRPTRPGHSHTSEKKTRSRSTLSLGTSTSTLTTPRLTTRHTPIRSAFTLRLPSTRTPSSAPPMSATSCICSRPTRTSSRALSSPLALGQRSQFPAFTSSDSTTRATLWVAASRSASTRASSRTARLGCR